TAGIEAAIRQSADIREPIPSRLQI
ncbi:pyrrolidone-carboxylate peptidase, partial [Mycobacterium tuberculosis]